MTPNRTTSIICFGGFALYAVALIVREIIAVVNKTPDDTISMVCAQWNQKCGGHVVSCFCGLLIAFLALFIYHIETLLRK